MRNSDSNCNFPLSIFLGLSLFISVAVLLLRSAVAFQSQYLNISAEAAGLIGVLNLVDNLDLYPSRFSEPYSIFLYNPLLPYLSSHLIRWLDVTDLFNQVLVVRGLVLFSFLLLLVTLFFLCVELRIKVTNRFLVVFLLGLAKLFDYLGTSRNDIPCLLFELLGLIFFLHFFDRRKISWILSSLFFCHLAFWTRQSSVVVSFAILIWFLYQKNFRLFFLSIGINLFFLIIYFVFMFHISGTNFIDHIFLANIRPWKPFDHSLITASNISFFLCLGIYVFLFLRSLPKVTKRDSKEVFCLLTIVLASIFALASWFRAGGDFNYFFLPLLLATPFVLKELELSWKEPYFKLIISFQICIIGLIYSLKIYKSFHYLNISYINEMTKLRTELNLSKHQRVLFSGRFSENSAIYLRDFALHGPEITSGCWLSKGSHPKFNWLFEQAKLAVSDGRVATIIQSEPDCYRNNEIDSTWPSQFKLKKPLTNWLCIYERS